MKQVLTLLLLACLTGCKSTSDLKVVEDFEVSRYLGVWYEAARMPHRFEKDLTAVTATYSANDDGTIKVLNRGFHVEKKVWEEIEGRAKLKGSRDSGRLKVSFFKPFYASYKIIYLDEAYTKAIVTGPTYGYLWILVRNPELPAEELDALIAKAAEFGFDTGRLIIVDHMTEEA